MGFSWELTEKQRSKRINPLLSGRKTTNLSLSGFLCLSADEAGRGGGNVGVGSNCVCVLNPSK
jgi:hypothetical protein